MFNKMLKKIIKRIISSNIKYQTDTVIIYRLNIPIKLRALNAQEIREIREKSIDNIEFVAKLIVTSTINFNWGSQILLNAFKTSDSKDVIMNILLAGEMKLLGEKVIKLSKYYILIDKILEAIKKAFLKSYN
ncbi:phage tail assembly chaperone [Clostridium beijerinckii]|uniref:phage tail assembly chaperone n=1 Tax=Clostridium beijerinckii TaxID=1520 RepID=UPI0003D2B665|nr:hypothetical protein [Clostridium beijerinckii]AQS18286.1 hypothetical protein X276_27035 [Clostridium beijerinckii NRRL B-598]